jgi:diguanylate cyclase (GGDEF)-like protein
VIGFTGGLPNAASLFFVWIVLVGAYYLSVRAAALHLGFALILYAIAAARSHAAHPLAANVIATAGALAGSAAIVAGLRRRLENLMTVLVETARSDPLTGLANRRAFFEDFDRALARAERADVAMAVAAVDIDNFKTVNDAVGHAGGDDVLVEFTRVLRDAVRAGDSAARIGGEEFALLLVAAEPEHARQLAERVRERVETAFGARTPPITVSIGVATWWPRDPIDAAVLLRRADAALYEAKRGGRNRVETYDGDRAGR